MLDYDDDDDGNEDGIANGDEVKPLRVSLSDVTLLHIRVCVCKCMSVFVCLTSLTVPYQVASGVRIPTVDAADSNINTQY